jgi:ceramide glucosyltransferase
MGLSAISVSAVAWMADGPVADMAARLVLSITFLTTLLTVCGMGYLLLVLSGARQFVRSARKSKIKQKDTFAPAVSILKPVKGLDPEMMAAFRSHCRQEYAGEYELIFGINSLSDPAVAAVHQLQQEFPERSIRLIECPERLGSNGKVSNLVQILPDARYEFFVINDSDINVSPQYLTHVMAEFAEKNTGRNTERVVGLVTAPYRGRAGRSFWSRLEALGISTDFFAGVMAARRLEGGLRFGMGSTLAVRSDALTAVGGLTPLLEYLADDYELGARMAKAGYRVALCHETVETAVPEYKLRGFLEHQLRWLRSARDSRRGGYLGLVVTYALPWAMLNCMASGLALWSFSLLSLVLLARTAVALSVGVGMLRDKQVLRDWWLLPLRDSLALLLWVWSYADNTVVWRGEKFRLDKGKLQRVS